MRRTAKQNGIEARPRIEKTKVLSLDERVAIVDGALEELDLPAVAESSKALAAWLVAHGYEPMMFGHACRIILSRRDRTEPTFDGEIGS